jgi:two-component system response regulator HupR/HoxA
VTGETGTGKELVARAIHEESGRSEWVAAAVTELCDGVLESELFGHERGAFTGAVARHTGLFEQADQGTLFLDEIGDAAPFLQAKLLRVLETGEVRPVGGGRVRRARPRVIVATHRDLDLLVREGAFRRDLYYRIHQVSLHIPPLRERPTDVEPIARALLAELAQDEGLAPPLSSSQSLAPLASLEWPGNVRELRSVLLNALLAWDGVSLMDPHSFLEARKTLYPEMASLPREEDSP